jgi:N-carbamoyl-L-amino-acid hydrolase
LKDGGGLSADEVRCGVGLRGELEDVKLPGGYYKAFAELHINKATRRQRVRLEWFEHCGTGQLRVSIEGASGHAGGVLMPDRQDAVRGGG